MGARLTIPPPSNVTIDDGDDDDVPSTADINNGTLMMSWSSIFLCSQQSSPKGHLLKCPFGGNILCVSTYVTTLFWSTCCTGAKDYVAKITTLGKLCLLVATIFMRASWQMQKGEYHTLAYDAQYIKCLLH